MKTISSLLAAWKQRAAAISEEYNECNGGLVSKADSLTDQGCQIEQCIKELESVTASVMRVGIIGCESKGYTVRIGGTDITHFNNSTDACRLATRLEFAIQRGLKGN